MDLFINIFHVVLSILLILVIILQPSKGSDIGAAFGGGGGSSTMFGPRGAGSVLSKATTVIAVLFMVTSITLAMRSVPKGGAGTSLSDDGALQGLDGIDLGLDDLDLDLGIDVSGEETSSDALESTGNDVDLEAPDVELEAPSDLSNGEGQGEAGENLGTANEPSDESTPASEGEGTPVAPIEE